MNGVPSRWLAATLAAGLAGSTLAVGLAPAAAAQPVRPETMMAERTNPAVQLVETTFTGTVTMRHVELSSAGNQLLGTAIAKYYTDELHSLSDIFEYTFERVDRDPTHYLKGDGKKHTKKFRQTYRGTGFLASPDGYLLTARHVVTADSDVRKSFAHLGATAFSRSESRRWLKGYAKFDPSNDAVQSLDDAIATYTAKRVKVHVSGPSVKVVLGVASADGTRVGKSYPAEVAYRSGAALGEDVAVIRMHAGDQMPSLALAATSPVQGDSIYLDGFPALPDGSKAALLQPTLTSGQITAVKANKAGIQQLQTDAGASPGSSGGAMLNQQGEVVGILVSGARDSNGSSLGQNYAMPLDSVRDALSRSGANPVAGQTTTLYDQGLDSFYADHYSAALATFRQVKELYPAHAYVDSYISRSQLAISQGKDVPVPVPAPASARVPWTTLALGAAGVLVLAVGLLIVLVLRRRGASGGRRAAGGAAPSPEAPPAAVATEQPWSVSSASDPVYAPVAASPLVTPAVGALAMATADDSVFDDDDAGQPTQAEDEVDEIPEWEPIDYVPAFPGPDSSRPSA